MKRSTQKGMRKNLNSIAGCCFLLTMIFNSSALYAAWEKQTIKEMVADEAGRQNFSIPLALAVAEVESNFDPYARSHVDARGVMQILPKTAEQDLNVRATSLYNPRVNIRAGVRFLIHLLSVYDGRVDIALSHYNGGSRVRQKDGSLKVIPATQGYVEKVLHKAKQYRSHPLANRTDEADEFQAEKNYQPVNITTLARRDDLDDFANGDPLLRHHSSHQRDKSSQSLTAIKTGHGNSKDSVIDKLKNLVIYNQNRVLSGGIDDDGSHREETNMRRDKKNGLVSEW